MQNGLNTRADLPHAHPVQFVNPAVKNTASLLDIPRKLFPARLLLAQKRVLPMARSAPFAMRFLLHRKKLMHLAMTGRMLLAQLPRLVALAALPKAKLMVTPKQLTLLLLLLAQKQVLAQVLTALFVTKFSLHRQLLTLLVIQ